MSLPPAFTASALAGAAVGGGWVLDALGVLPAWDCGALSVTAGAAVLWWAGARSRGASRGVAYAEGVRAERDAALGALHAVLACVAKGRQDIRQAAEQARQGLVSTDLAPLVERAPTGDPCVDAVALSAQAFEEAWRAVLDAAARQHRMLNARAELADIFTSISPRLLSLVNRGIAAISDVERDVEDPQLMDELFKVDHLLTQIRRAVESLSVLGGATPPRESAPLVLGTVIRRAIAEIPAFARVRMAVSRGFTVALPGYVSPNVVHLLAELMENATAFSGDRVEVFIFRAGGNGVAIEIIDRGTGMSQAKHEELNRLLAAPEAEDPRARLREGRIGLMVAALLAQRHKIVIRVEPNIVGGTRAIVLLPPGLLVSADVPSAHRPAVQVPRPALSGPVRREHAVPGQEGGAELPRRVRTGPPAGDGPAASDDGRPPLPRRGHADRQRVPPTAPQAPIGAATSGLMADFQSRRPSGDKPPPQRPAE